MPGQQVTIQDLSLHGHVLTLNAIDESIKAEGALGLSSKWSCIQFLTNSTSDNSMVIKDENLNISYRFDSSYGEIGIDYVGLDGMIRSFNIYPIMYSSYNSTNNSSNLLRICKGNDVTYLVTLIRTSNRFADLMANVSEGLRVGVIGDGYYELNAMMSNGVGVAATLGDEVISLYINGILVGMSTTAYLDINSSTTGLSTIGLLSENLYYFGEWGGLFTIGMSGNLHGYSDILNHLGELIILTNGLIPNNMNGIRNIGYKNNVNLCLYLRLTSMGGDLEVYPVLNMFSDLVIDYSYKGGLGRNIGYAITRTNCVDNYYLGNGTTYSLYSIAENDGCSDGRVIGESGFGANYRVMEETNFGENGGVLGNDNTYIEIINNGGINNVYGFDLSSMQNYTIDLWLRFKLNSATISDLITFIPNTSLLQGMINDGYDFGMRPLKSFKFSIGVFLDDVSGPILEKVGFIVEHLTTTGYITEYYPITTGRVPGSGGNEYGDIVPELVSLTGGTRFRNNDLSVIQWYHIALVSEVNPANVIECNLFINGIRIRKSSMNYSWNMVTIINCDTARIVLNDYAKVGGIGMDEFRITNYPIWSSYTPYDHLLYSDYNNWGNLDIAEVNGIDLNGNIKDLVNPFFTNLKEYGDSSNSLNLGNGNIGLEYVHGEDRLDVFTMMLLHFNEPIGVIAGKVNVTFTITNNEFTYSAGVVRSCTITPSVSGLVLGEDYIIEYRDKDTGVLIANPINAGIYTINVNIVSNHALYTGSAMGEMIIHRAIFSATIGDIEQVYTGSTKSILIAANSSYIINYSNGIVHGSSGINRINVDEYPFTIRCGDAINFDDNGGIEGVLSIIKSNQVILGVSEIPSTIVMGNGAYTTNMIIGPGVILDPIVTATSGLQVTMRCINLTDGLECGWDINKVGNYRLIFNQGGDWNYLAATMMIKDVSIISKGVRPLRYDEKPHIYYNFRFSSTSGSF